MSIYTDIPTQYQNPFMREELIRWVRSLPISFHDRLAIYFSWLDHFGQPYTADEIDSLKPTVAQVVDITSE
jgi:hypothetical protein